MRDEPVGRAMEILLVEDSLTDARVTIGNLRQGRIQHRLTLIRDGLEAMEFLYCEGKFARAPRPDLILLDLLLPKMDGLEVLSKLKSSAELNDIPVVVLTVSDEEEDRLQSERLGVDAYITKPVNLEKFVAVVRQLRSFWHADLILPALD